MKKAVGILAVVLMATTAYGAGSLTVVAPASADPGVPFEIQVLVDSNEPVITWQLAFAGTGLTVVDASIVVASPFGNFVDNYGDAYNFGLPINTAGWSTAAADVLTWAAGVPLDGTIVGALHQNQGQGPAFGVRMTVVGDTPGIALLSGAPEMGKPDFTKVTDMAIVPAEVLITPEPASLMLLLAGLPLLRRRR